MHRQKNESLFPVGIIAGKGFLPIELARISKNLNHECRIAFLNEYDAKDLVQDLSCKVFNIGNVGSIIDYFKSNNIVNIILAGSIDRPNLSTIKVDMTGALLMTKILKRKFLGDDSLLRIVADFLEDRNFRIISAVDVLSLDNRSCGLSTIKTPSKQDEIDIKLGHTSAKALGALDIGQSVIIEDGYILGVEAAEGTDRLIERCTFLRKKPQGGVLVKALKPIQDTRLDIPAIGTTTIKKLAESKYNGVALESENVIIIDPISTFKLANELNIFIRKL